MRNWSSRCSHALWSGDQLLKRDSHESLRRMSKAFQFSIGLSGRLVAPLTLSQQPPKRCKGSKHDRPCLDLSLIHISEPTRLGMISYAVFCLKKKKSSK